MSSTKAKLVSFRDVFWTGCSLVIAYALDFVGGGYIYSFLEENNIDNSTDGEDTLEEIHEQVSEYRTGLLISVALMWLAIPFLLTHLYCFKLLCESLFTSLIPSTKSNSIVHYLKWLYILNNILLAGVFALMGIFTFLACYYHWSFVDTSDSTSYTGYYIQFMLLCGDVALNDFGSFVAGISGSVPWILLLLSNMDNVVIYDLCCFTWCLPDRISKTVIRFSMALIIIIVFVCCLMDAFNWASIGFFDPDNGSSQLGWVGLLSQALSGLWCIYLSIRINDVKKLINETNNYQQYSTIQGADAV